MALYNLDAEPANTAPVAKAWPHDLTLNFARSVRRGRVQPPGEQVLRSEPRSAVVHVVRERSGDRQRPLLYINLAPGTHHLTLVVRDNAGGESRDTATITVTPYEEIVIHTAVHGRAARRLDA